MKSTPVFVTTTAKPIAGLTSERLCDSLSAPALVWCTARLARSGSCFARSTTGTPDGTTCASAPGMPVGRESAVQQAAPYGDFSFERI